MRLTLTTKKNYLSRTKDLGELGYEAKMLSVAIDAREFFGT